MKFLSQDEKEAVAEFMLTPGWPGLLKMVNAIYEKQKEAVMEYDLSRGPEGLMILKARARRSCRPESPGESRELLIKEK